MTRAAPGGALREGRFRPGTLLAGGRSGLPLVAGSSAGSQPPGSPSGSGADGGSAEDHLLPPTPLPAPRSTRRARRAWMIALIAAAAVGAAAWFALASPLATVTTVDVSGVSPRWAAQVRAAAAREIGRRAVLVDTAAVAARVRAVPGVLAADVGVSWPHTLTVRVVERVPAVGVRVAGGVRLFDRAGVDLGVQAAAPAGLLLVVVPPAAVRPAVLLATLHVQGDLPSPLQAEVAAIGATSPDAVWLRLRDGTRVTWGSDGDPAAKATALAALRRTMPPGRPVTLDVSAADAPAVSS